MAKPRVLLKDQPDYSAPAIQAHASAILEQTGLKVKDLRVLVKPSFVYPTRDPVALGVITRPEFLAGVAAALRDHGAREVLVAESSVLGPSRVSFHSTGVLPLLKGLATPVFLDEAETVEVEIKDPLVQKRFTVPRVWLEADLYLSLPKIKVNLFAQVTLSIKNNLGLLRQKDRLLYHDYRLHRKLADLYRVRPPDLVIADCIVAGEGQGPLLAEPVPLGLMVAGTNPVAVDAVSCRLIGYEPAEVEHLRLLHEKGCGPLALSEIEVEPAALLAKARRLRRPQVSLSGLSPRLRAFEGTELSCPGGCLGLVRGAVDAYLALYGPENLRPFNVILGKPIAELPADLDPDCTLVLGDCARPFADRGEFVPGCCPLPLEIGYVVRRILGPIEVAMRPRDVMAGYAGHRWWRLRQLLAGKPLAPIENHVPSLRVLREYAAMLRQKLSRAQAS
jgi:uncharacterized protein (DUF362 family)